MIRVIIESFLAFMLPAALYISFGLITRGPNTTVGAVFNRAPLLALTLLGAVSVVTIMLLFSRVGDGKPGQAYEPAVFEDGKVVPGRMR
jgi:Family of unknown function (DUF6111)